MGRGRIHGSFQGIMMLFLLYRNNKRIIFGSLRLNNYFSQEKLQLVICIFPGKWAYNRESYGGKCIPVILLLPSQTVLPRQ